ncbi:ribbon-helix-helix domain-containing protein [Candidatus Woesearchaeota archaeon]|nr:ribbon-helix-helix domain-containing protein [Candidatus Woesearchaeota archaeon]
MLDQIISIRVPESLVKKLEKLAESEDYMDVSEAVRSILRSKWKDQEGLTQHHIEQLRKEINELVGKMGVKK